MAHLGDDERGEATVDGGRDDGCADGELLDKPPSGFGSFAGDEQARLRVEEGHIVRWLGGPDGVVDERERDVADPSRDEEEGRSIERSRWDRGRRELARGMKSVLDDALQNFQRYTQTCGEEGDRLVSVLLLV